MAYGGNPATDPRDAIRVLLGDTDPSAPLLDDDVLDFLLAEHNGNIYKAAADAARSLATRYVKMVSVSGEGLSYDGGAMYRQYLDLAEHLDKMAKRRVRGPVPYAGGISHAERVRDDADHDLIQTSFRSQMHDNPGAGRADEDELRPPQ